MKSLTVAYITSRYRPEVHWLFESLDRQAPPGWDCDIIVVDGQKHRQPRMIDFTAIFRTRFSRWSWVRPKPTPWQGPSRLTQADWFAAANARNTAIALCQTEWFACLDDRSVLCPGWLDAIARAMSGGYAVCGSYEKRTGMTVDRGAIAESGTVIGKDGRENMVTHNGGDVPCGGEWWFGCNTALPIEWALAINGYDESCDGLGMEDVIFGLHLHNAGFPIRYDPTMRIVEDRTTQLSGPVMLRTDKGVSPNDKSHALLNRLRHLKQSTNRFDLREIRQRVADGGSFPEHLGPTVDWYDGQPLADMTASPG